MVLVMQTDAPFWGSLVSDGIDEVDVETVTAAFGTVEVAAREAGSLCGRASAGPWRPASPPLRDCLRSPPLSSVPPEATGGASGRPQIDEVVTGPAGIVRETSRVGDRAGYFAALYRQVTVEVRTAIPARPDQAGADRPRRAATGQPAGPLAHDVSSRPPAPDTTPPTVSYRHAREEGAVSRGRGRTRSGRQAHPVGFRRRPGRCHERRWRVRRRARSQ